MNCIVTVDRIEGTWARLEAPDGTTFDVPQSLIPNGVDEGDTLDWQVTPNENAAAERRRQLEARLRGLTEEDDGGDIDL